MKDVSVNKEEKALEQERPASIIYSPDQKYRWTYEVTLFNDPGPLLTAWKIGIAALVVAAIAYFGSRLGTGFGAAVGEAFKLLYIGAIVLTVLSLIVWIVLIILKVGRRNILYELDALGIHIIKMNDQVTSAEIKTYLSALDGRVKGDPALKSVIMLGGVKASHYVVFADIRRVTLHRRRHHIELRSKRRRLQIYVTGEQLPFVQAKIKRAVRL